MAFLKAVSHVRGSEKYGGCSPAHLIQEFKDLLQNLQRGFKSTNLRQSAQNSSQRYDELGNVDDLSKAIDFYEQALIYVPPTSPILVDIVIDLNAALEKRYECLGDVTDVSKSIEWFSAFVIKLPSEHKKMATIMDRLGLSYLRRFERIGHLDDIEQGIQYLAGGVSLAQINDKEIHSYLNNLGMGYGTRSVRLGDTNDINQAIILLEQAVFATSARHGNLPIYLMNLGRAYLQRFEQGGAVGEVEDLKRSVECLSHSVRLTPSNNKHLPDLLISLESALEKQYKYSGDPRDIDHAIARSARAVSLTPTEHPDWLRRVRALARSHLRRFEHYSQTDDIVKTIECLTEVTLHVPSDHPDMFACLDDLGTAYIRRFEHQGDSIYVEKAVEYQQRVVQLIPAEHPSMSFCLGKLGTALELRFRYRGDIQDIHYALECHRKAVELNPKGDSGSSVLLFSLGTDYLSLFIRLGKVEHADLAIENLNRALTLVSTSSERSNVLMNLGKAYMEIYRRLGQPGDLDRAIQCQIQAVELTPVDYAEMAMRLNNLGQYLQVRFDDRGDPQDLENAILCESKAVEVAPEIYAARAIFVTSLGVSYLSRFDKTMQLDDIHSAVNYFEQAVALTPEGHTAWSGRLNNLGNALGLQFSSFGGSDILNKSIEVQTLAASLLPAEHSFFPGMFCNLGRLYGARYAHFGDVNAFCQAINCFKASAESPIGDPQTRFKAARMYATLLSHLSLTHSLSAYQIGINLIPQLIRLGTTVDKRYKDIPQIGDMIQDAIAVAVNADNYLLALEWLEQGRSVVLNQMLQLRTPIDHLGSHRPDLVEKLRQIAESLHHASSNPVSSLEPSKNVDYPSSPEQIARGHRGLATEYERLLSEARMVPGFENFLLPRKATEFFRVAKTNPVVVIHAHKFRCDALALLPGYPTVHHIPLPNITFDIAKAASLQIQASLHRRGVRERSSTRGIKPVGPRDYFKSVLAILWVDVVKPILETLGGSELPHITWCPTGPFSLLPIHAAGYYDRPMEKLSDYAISSYTPSLTALLSVNKNIVSPLSSMLAVGQEATPGRSRLPQTVAELAQIKGHVQPGTTYMQLDKDSATVSSVLKAMEDHSCVHLACHAYQNLQNPVESGFHLQDGTLTLRTIMQRSFQGKQLAFLSACQTAAGDDQIPDEAVHLASGMLMAGYPSVIATMWSISDTYAPLVADEVYARLLKRDTFQPGDTAKALHFAVAKLREKVGNNDYIRWVPYIHMGI
ncbi:CHAT domain-containing protein [Rhizoctonia solani]|nr:CHAT domain-containing protein [Rhizoctonia solani]